jgi:5-methyltetrahydrofolate--homocysteine methyltransferase
MPLHRTVLRSATKEVVIGHDLPFTVIGERINPTGRKKFQEQLRAGDLSAVETDVAAQVAGGANVLDINMGVPLTDEPELLRKAILLVQSLTDLPICIDSSVIEALEVGLETYQGRALVNSVTAEDDRLAAILPLVKRHDAAIIALPNDEDEIPMEADKRLELTRKIVRVATQEYGIAIEDIVIDPLAMPIGADTSVVAPRWTQISRVARGDRAQHDAGASNVSFGHAGQTTRRAAFQPMAMVPDSPARSWTPAAPRSWSRCEAAPTCCSATTSGARAGSRHTGPQAAAAAAEQAAGQALGRGDSGSPGRIHSSSQRGRGSRPRGADRAATRLRRHDLRRHGARRSARSP